MGHHRNTEEAYSMLGNRTLAGRLRNDFADEKKIHTDLNISMLFRYCICVFSMVFLFLFRNQLPFPFPDFFLVCCVFLLVNNILHIASMKKRLLKKIYTCIPYFDTIIAPLVFQFSGGFLCPFVITHIVTSFGSSLMNTNDYRISRRLAIILSISYLSVALLQKFGVLPCPVPYAQTMMANTFFFVFIVSITTFIIIACHFLAEMLSIHAYQMLEEIIRSFDSVVKGTAPTVGHDFFVQVIKNISESLSVRCAMVAELTKKNTSLQSLAVWKDGNPDENFESPVSGTVFADVLLQKRCIIDKNVANRYPSNPLLAQCKAVFFYGVLLIDSKDRPIGMLCLIHAKAVPNRYLVEPLMTIFASRASAELERKIAEEKQKIIEMQFAHAHKMEAIGNLVGGIAHDFNNMVSAIGGCAQLLKSKLAVDSPHQRYVTHIINAGEHTTELINRLTGFARRDKPPIVPVDVHKVIDDAFVLMESATCKNITLRKKLLASESIIPSDDASLQSAVLNIAINARDAMENGGGTLTFETSVVTLDTSNTLCQSFQIAPGDYISLSITDTGVGMNDEIMRHLFEPFYTTKPKGKGNGFGLANVWGFIENYKCAIDIKSKTGSGSTFTLYLPLLRKTVEQSGARDGSFVHTPLTIDNIKTIMIVDDEASQREVSREMLHNKGFSLVFKENGLEAVNFIKEAATCVDLVILDLVMPVMNGQDAFHEMRKIDPEIKILIASGYINEKDLQGITKERKTAFIQKPFSEDMLFKAIYMLSVTAG
jgi:signal transduction histidine kinase/ActR/RegA family two-component response regulator